MRLCPRSARVVLAGDWNVPAILSRHGGAGEECARSRARAAALRDVARTLRVRRQLPEALYADEARGPRDPALGDTRRPVGELARFQEPSLLDYFYAGDVLEAKVWGTWRGAPADHALVGVQVAHPPPPPPRRRRKWVCSDWDVAVGMMRDRAPDTLGDAGVAALAQLLRAEASDARTCAGRRRDRIPAAVRLLWRMAVGATASNSAALRAEAARQLRAYVALRQRGRLRKAVREGRALFRDPALCPLRGPQVGDARECDAAIIGPAVLEKFGAVWQSRDLAASEVI